MKGKPKSEITKAKLSIAHTGKPLSKEHKQKLSVKKLELYANPKNHPLWQGGKSFDHYPIKWTQALKRAVKERDNYICRVCKTPEKGLKKKLAIHHIDYDKNNCAMENLVALCNACHSKTNHKRDYWKAFFHEEAIPKEARKQGLIVEGKVKQDNGEWWKIKVPSSRKRVPVEAFGVLPVMQERKEKEKKK